MKKSKMLRNRNRNRIKNRGSGQELVLEEMELSNKARKHLEMKERKHVRQNRIKRVRIKKVKIHESFVIVPRNVESEDESTVSRKILSVLSFGYL